MLNNYRLMGVPASAQELETSAALGNTRSELTAVGAFGEMKKHAKLPGVSIADALKARISPTATAWRKGA